MVITKEIWKFPLLPESTKISVPEHAVFLTLQVQNNEPCLWFIVDPKNRKVTKTFRVIMTGESVHAEEFVASIYRGTFQVDEGRFVGHVFERLFK